MSKRITVEVSDDTNEYLEAIRKLRGISISSQANYLIEQAIKERNRPSRKRKSRTNGSAPTTHEQQ